MNATIIDNNDFMLIINCTEAIIQHLQEKGLFSRIHSLSPRQILARSSLDDTGRLIDDLNSNYQNDEWNLVAVRYSSGSYYFSSDNQDQNNGRTITG